MFWEAICAKNAGSKMNLRQSAAQTVSYAGIIRIRFQGFKARLPRLSRKPPAPLLIVPAL
jgi:hypothetical protein